MVIYRNPPRVLYIESYQASCEMVGQMLWVEKFDCEFTIANTPSQALILTGSKSFDLCILEYRLPEMTGVELCRRIRKTDPVTPILFFTVESRQIERNTAFAAGATDYLVKPYDLPVLVDTVKRLLFGRAEVPSYKLQVSM